MATYFGANYGQFLMAVSFVMARILRSNKVDETWCELKTMFYVLFSDRELQLWANFVEVKYRITRDCSCNPPKPDAYDKDKCLLINLADRIEKATRDWPEVEKF